MADQQSQPEASYGVHSPTALALTFKESIEKRMSTAVWEGKLEDVKCITEKFGLSYSENWLDGYVLLCEAVDHRQNHVAKYLIEAGCKLNHKNEYSGVPLHFAVRRNNIEIVRMLLEKGAHVDARTLNKERCTALLEAVLNNNIEITTLLLSSGAYVNIPTACHRKTALHFAVENNQKELVDLLLGYEANVNAVYKDEEKQERTVLYLAVKKRYGDIVRCLLKYHPDVNDTGNRHAAIVAMFKDTAIFASLREYGYAPIPCDENNVLFDAICRGDVNEVEGLLENNVDFKELLVRDNGQCTPLHVATRYRREQVAQLLIKYSANANAKDVVGKSPVVYAIENGDFSMIEILLTNEKNINEALCSAVSKENIKSVEYLLKRGADVNARYNDGLTVLHYTIPRASMDLFKMLLDYEADVNFLAVVKSEFDCHTPLHYSVRYHNLKACKILLNRGADIHAKTPKGNSVLHIACRRGGLNNPLSLLLKRGADVNATCDGLGTAHHTAAAVGVVGNLELLLEYGSDINDRVSLDGNTALDCARYGSIRKYEGPSSEERCVHLGAIHCLLRHLVKLKTANLYVNERNQEYLEPKTFHMYCGKTIASPKKHISTGYVFECAKEVEILKTTVIDGCTLTYYQILIANYKKLVNISKNETIKKTLLRNDFEVKFPIYAGLIRGKFEIGRRRRELENKSRGILLKIPPFLPSDCVDIIHNYLTNEDLRLLINARSGKNI